MIKALCKDDSGKPENIPLSKWVKKDSFYNIVKVTIHPLQGNIQGCELAEITLDESCSPYEYFRLSRFAFREVDIPALVSLIKNSSELNDVDIADLTEKEVETI